MIGRSPTSDLVLDDPFVSQTHARVVPRGQLHFVEDLGSTNGTVRERARGHRGAAHARQPSCASARRSSATRSERRVTLVARHAALTDIGLHRSTNEDAYLAAAAAVRRGRRHGRARRPARSRRTWPSRRSARASPPDAALPDAAQAANAARLRAFARDTAHSGMGTTLTAARLGGERARVRARRRQPRCTCCAPERSSRSPTTTRWSARWCARASSRARRPSATRSAAS